MICKLVKIVQLQIKSVRGRNCSGEGSREQRRGRGLDVGTGSIAIFAAQSQGSRKGGGWM
jgi:hypothetical protein